MACIERKFAYTIIQYYFKEMAGLMDLDWITLYPYNTILKKTQANV